MILGRSTVQWTALITLTLDFVLIVIGVAFTEHVGTATIILSGLGVLLAGWIVFLANTATTPIGDARLKSGTDVTVLDDDGKSTGDTVTIQPSPPGPTGHDAVGGHG